MYWNTQNKAEIDSAINYNGTEQYGICICNRMRPSGIQSFHKIARVAQRRGQFMKTLKIQVKFILNSTRTQCDYLFITQRAKFSETFPCTLKHNQPALRIKQFIPVLLWCHPFHSITILRHSSSL